MPSKPQTPDLHTTCRTSEGGSPQCSRAGLCKTVEIRGASLESIVLSRQQGTPYRRPDELKHYPIMILLESPDFKDDRVGALGYSKTLNKVIDIVQQAGIHLSDVFLTTYVRCKTKHKPGALEKKACAGHTLYEMSKVMPKVIVTMGKGPLHLFKMDKGPLGKIRGQIYRHNIVTLDKFLGKTTFWRVVPTYDPNMFYHNPDHKLIDLLMRDFRLAKRVSEGDCTAPDEFNVPHFICEKPEHVDLLANELNNSKIFSIDTESRSLPWMTEPMTCASITYRSQIDGPDGLTVNMKDGLVTAILPLYKHNPNVIFDVTEIPKNEWPWKLMPHWSTMPEHTFNNVALMMGGRKGIDQLKKLKPAFENPKIDKIIFNAKYDMCVLRRTAGIKVKGFIYDPMMMHHILLEYWPHDLEYLADIEFATGDYSGGLNSLVEKSDTKLYDEVPDYLLWPYTACDSFCSYKLAQVYTQRLKQKPHLWNLYVNETQRAIHTLGKAEWFGTKIDEEMLDLLYEDFNHEKEELRSKIELLTFPGFNPASTAQLVQVIKDAGHEDKIKDKKNKSGYCTDKERMAHLANEMEVAEHIVDFRNRQKMISTFLEYPKNEMVNGRIHVSFRLHGTETGRISCTFLHQLPRVDKRRKRNLRDMIVAPDGYQIVYMDYSQIELRLLAIIANDEEMLRLFQEGADVHIATAAAILDIDDKDVTPFNRQALGKKVNFGLAYGSEGHNLVRTGEWEDETGKRHPVTWAMLERGMQRFRSRFPGIMDYIDNVPDQARLHGGIIWTPFGRERRMGAQLNDENEGTRKHAERELLNFSIQSPAGGIMIRTFNMVDDKLTGWIDSGRMAEDDVYLFMTVHDSGLWYVRDKYVDWFQKQVKTIAERSIPELDNYSFPVDIGVGRSWTEAEANAH